MVVIAFRCWPIAAAGCDRHRSARDGLGTLAVALAQAQQVEVELEQVRRCSSLRTMLSIQKKLAMRAPRVTGVTSCTLVPG